MFERTNHMPRDMVIGKLKYLIGPVSGLYFHPLLDEVQDERGSRTLYSRWVTLIHGRERKEKYCVGDFSPCVCVRFALQG